MKFSQRWLRNASDETLAKERELLRPKAVYEGESYVFTIMNLIDREMARRMNEKYEREHPNAQARHREHGWYLPNEE